MIIGLIRIPSSFLVSKHYFFFNPIFYSDERLGFLLFIFPLIFMLVYLCSFSYLSLRYNIFRYFVFIWILFFLSLRFFSNTIFFFLLFLESCVILIVLFIFRIAKDQDKASSSLFIFLINIFPSLLFIYSCWSNSFSLFFSESSYVTRFIFYIFFLGLLCSKLPLFVLHFWLTKAHVRASGPGSIVLARLLLKIGCVGFYKFSFSFGGPFFKHLLYTSFSLSILGFFFILRFILRFCDLKFMVACSSVVHIAPTFPLLLNRDSLSAYSSFLIIIGHGLISYFIFFLVSCLYEVSQRKRSALIKSIESYSRVFASWTVIFLLVNIGFPPFMTFIREVLFSYLFFIFSSINFLVFIIGLIFRGMVFFLATSKLLFIKKSNFFIGGYLVSFRRFSYLFFSFFVFSFFLYKCSVSLV